MDKKEENTGKLKAQPRDSHIYTLETQKRRQRKWKGLNYQRTNVGMSPLTEVCELLYWEAPHSSAPCMQKTLHQSTLVWNFRTLGIKAREKDSDRDRQRQDSEFKMAANLTIVTLDNRTEEQYFQIWRDNYSHLVFYTQPNYQLRM